MSRSPTGHGFWVPANIAGDAWPALLATNPCKERSSGLRLRRRHTPAPSLSTQGSTRLPFAPRPSRPVMWVIDGCKTRDVIA